SKLLVTRAGGQHDDIARPRGDRHAGIAAELHRHLAVVDAEHLMAVAMEVMKGEDTVSPRRGPAVACKHLLESRCRIGSRDDDRARIDQQWPARVVRNCAVRGEQVCDDVRHGHGARSTEPLAYSRTASRATCLPP